MSTLITPLRIGATYERGDGRRARILGEARPDGYPTPHMLWSQQGDWYCAHSGRFVYTDWDSGSPFCKLMNGYRDLQRHV